jgi:hypothetical protein
MSQFQCYKAYRSTILQESEKQTHELEQQKKKRNQHLTSKSSAQAYIEKYSCKTLRRHKFEVKGPR